MSTFYFITITWVFSKCSLLSLTSRLLGLKRKEWGGVGSRLRRKDGGLLKFCGYVLAFTFFTSQCFSV